MKLAVRRWISSAGSAVDDFGRGPDMRIEQGLLAESRAQLRGVWDLLAEHHRGELEGHHKPCGRSHWCERARLSSS
eukprot:8029043-Prorocentrum_lima.AAC.1